MIDATREVVIQSRNLKKAYVLHHQERARYASLREEIAQGLVTLRKAFASVSKQPKKSVENFWALDGVDFEISRGDRVGILGRNGAGKSTLLKILSRIIEPTAGSVRLRGRLASLLEVGTGFHPELTGRENIYLNGAVLGMARADIQRKFDEIVAFAEVEKFLDTQVKRYSSGMYMRLAFSVAAHLDPEILIIDEVLAVGDSAFQKKCIDRMTDISKSGRTLLFVSHNLQAIRTLCTRAIVLESGRVVVDSDVSKAIQVYTSQFQLTGVEIDLTGVVRKKYSGEVKLAKVRFEQCPIPFGRPIRFYISLQRNGNVSEISDIDLAVSISDKDGNYVIHACNRFLNKHLVHREDSVEYFFEIQNFLKPNFYYMTLFLRAKDTIQDWLSDVVSFEVQDGNPYGFYDSYQIQGATLPQFSVEQVQRPH